MRKSAHHLSEEEEERIAAAWRKMTENKEGKPGTSEYFALERSLGDHFKQLCQSAVKDSAG